MNRRRVFIGGSVTLALVALGIPLLQAMRHSQLDNDLRGAILKDKPEQVKALLVQGADPNSIGPWRASGESWRKQLDRLFGRSKASVSASALGIATDISLSGDVGIDGHWNPVVISALLAHGAKLNPTDPQQPWGCLKGWTLDDSGFGMAYIQRFNFPPGSRVSPIGIGRIGFEKHRGEVIISAFRKAGLKAG